MGKMRAIGVAEIVQIREHAYVVVPNCEPEDKWDGIGLTLQLIGPAEETQRLFDEKEAAMRAENAAAGRRT
jgi:hypothetical protein